MWPQLIWSKCAPSGLSLSRSVSCGNGWASLGCGIPLRPKSTARFTQTSLTLTPTKTQRPASVLKLSNTHLSETSSICEYLHCHTQTHTTGNQVCFIWKVSVVYVVFSHRYDIKSTETVFDNATRSRIVSPEVIINDAMMDVLFCIWCLTPVELFRVCTQVAEIISRTTCRQTCQTTGEVSPLLFSATQ